nr:MAG TPA: hypothetical protein [Caudoviricetes sp.]
MDINFDLEELFLHSKQEAEAYANVNDIIICELTDNRVKLFGNNMQSYAIDIRKTEVLYKGDYYRVLSLDAAKKQIIIQDEEYLTLDVNLEIKATHKDFISAYKELKDIR